ncbi:MAG: hypothetical protein HZR80_10770 [Candidatus Heimdallarchaeota archaeon]
MSYLFDKLKTKDGKAKVEAKILLMGLQEAGKTTIKDVVFFGKELGEVEDYMATIHYERQFIDDEKENLIIDSGGQEAYWNEAVTQFRHLVFSNVKLLLWIIDMTRSDLFEESERRFSFTIRQFKKENPKGKIAVLCHKVDLIPPEEVVALLDQIKINFDEPKYKIQFEPSSIYYPDSLKELIFTLMKNAKMNVKRFELITNLGKKIEESEEFKSYIIDNKEDPRILQLMEFLNPSSETTLPTFGKASVQFDLSKYDIIELVLINKETNSPVIGTASQGSVSIETSLDYILALQEFKEIIKERKIDEDSTILVVTSSNKKVHGMIVNLGINFLLMTSFSPISEEKTKTLFGLIREFSKSIDIPTKINEVIPEVSTIKPVEVTTPTTNVTPKIPEEVVKAPEVIKPSKEVVADGEVTEEKSMFSFINQLRDNLKTQSDEEVILEEESTDEIIQEKVIVPTLEKEIEPEDIQVPPEPIIEPTSLEEAAEEVIEAPVVEIVEVQPEPEPAKRKPSFVSRLKAERRRYKIKQIQMKAEKLNFSEDDLKELAEFLTKENSSEEKETKKETK